MRFLAVLTVRNESAFLLEWLAHHMAVGFTDFLVFSNNCQDNTVQMLDHLAQQNLLTHVRNDGPHDGGVQWTALKQADKHPLVKQADWILTLDIDEFVNIHVGGRRLPDLLAALPDATAITLTWRLFGNDGVQQYLDKPITGQFSMAAPKIMYWPWRASMFKTLYRNDGVYRKLGVHRPRSPDKSRLNDAAWFDGCGRELDDRFKRQQIFSPFGRDNYELVQLNHYPLGSMESYILKTDRGRAVHCDDVLGMSYWVERNWCEEEDTSISALASARDVILAELLTDTALAELHGYAAEWRKSRYETLMKQEPNRALMGKLIMTPPARPLSLQAAQCLYRFAKEGARKND